MRKYKKKLEESVNASIKNMRDEDFLLSLKDYNKELREEKKKVPQKKLKLVFASSVVTMLLIIAIVGTVILYPQKSEEKTYFKDNEVHYSSTIEELNAITENVDFKFNTNVLVSRFYDKKYEEDLYFVISGEIQGDMHVEIFSIIVIVNENYKQVDFEKNYDKECSLKDKELIYEESFIFEDDLYSFKANGRLSVGQEIVLIQYEHLTYEENSLFIPFVERVVTF